MMTTTIKRLASVGSSIALLATAAVPAFAANVNVVGNGAFSFTGVTVTSSVTKSLGQANFTSANTTVNQGANSGNNNVAFSTGGSSAIVTGPATASTSVTNGGSSNSALVAGCGCPADPATINVVGNGAFATSLVGVSNTSTTTVTQVNATSQNTTVNQGANSGGNSSAFNTGTGTVISTGPASVGTTVMNGGSSNTAVLP